MGVIGKLKSYIKENPGAPFIIGFIILLVAAAIALAVNMEGTANTLAEYAYYSLVIGVLLQIAVLIKERKKP